MATRRNYALLALWGLVLSVMAGQPLHAAGGRIDFRGAIVEPTCGMQPAAVKQLATGAAAPVRLGCADGAAGGAGNAPQSYAAKLVALPASRQDGDRLLAYFAAYAAQGGEAARTGLLVQTYD